VIGLNLRPAFSYDYFLSSAFIGLFTALRTTLLPLEQQILSHQSCDAINESLVLHALTRAKSVLHIPDILHFRHRIAGDFSNKRLDPRSVENHLKEIGFSAAAVSQATTPGIYRVRFHAPSKDKTVIIIPTKNQTVLLQQAVESIYETVPAELFDLVVIDHESDEPDSLAYLESLKADHTILPYQGEFNFSKINNFAVSHLGKHYSNILFLNNDIEAIRTGWFESMLDKLKRPDVGIVGAVLLYPYNSHQPNQPIRAGGTVDTDSLSTHHRIQHAGVVLGIGNAEHFMKHEVYQDPYNDHVSNSFLPPIVSRGFSAVTAACLMIQTDVFHAMEGFDEALVVGFGDVDLCLRTNNNGYKVLCDGEAVLIHHESASRNRGKLKDPHPWDSSEFSYRYQFDIDHGDPFYSPLLTTSTWRYRPVRSPVRPKLPVYRIVTDPGIRPP
jgi:GT2 family glycosyltransferase